ncbi:MAG TPA: TonB-dependent receptor [Bryobacteraceae bacterium]|jgi:hypothetical protein|nr:TonB-dependent receptor [Bryobacteraceae bacterium]
MTKGQARVLSTGCACFAYLLLPIIAYAQSTFGDIRGLTRDPAGLALPQSQVTLHNLDDNTTHTAITDDNANFLFENLKPGHYTLEATKEGFAKSQLVSVELVARESARVELPLSLAQTQQTVSVEATAGQINTENSVIGDSKTTSDLVQMPLNFRAQTTSPLAALGLSPNVITDSQGNISVAGATYSMTGFSVDGISTADITHNGSLQNAYPSSEGLAELKVTAFNNSAEFAQVADVTFITKSGTNQLHGSLFEYLQNDVLDATILNFGTKAPKRFNTFGGSLGGPVSIPHLYNGKDRTFFFIDYEGNRRRTSVPEQYLVPSLDQRNGNLSGLPIIDPASGASSNTLIDPTNGQPFPNNTIPTPRLNAVSRGLLAGYYPLPNVNGGGSFNYETLQPTPATTNGFDIRLDHNITSNQQVYARFSWKNLRSDAVNPLLPNDINVEHDRSLLVSYNYTITPRTVNEFRFGFTNSLINTTFPIQGATADNQLGLTGISFANHPTTGAFPTFNFSDGSGFTPIGRDKDGPGKSQTYQFTDNLTHTRGRHTIRVGLDGRRVFYETVVRWGQSDDFGAFTFNQGVFTGSAYGDFLLGAPNTDFIVGSSPNTNEPSLQWGVYAQDQWQVNDRLTVNFGLRWEVLPEFTENQGDIANFDPRNGDVVVPDVLLNKTVASSPLLAANYNAFLVSFNACQLPTRDMTLPCSNVITASQDHLSQSLRNTYWHDFDPRISVAFRPFRDNKTVIRAGFGIFTQTPLGQLAYDFIGIPLGAPYTYSNNNGAGTPLFTFPQTSPTNQALQYGGTGFYDGMDPNFRDAQTAQWNVTIERQVTAATAVRATYAGMNSYRMNVKEDYNAIRPSAQPYVPSPYVDPRAPYQNWIEINYSKNAAFANYQGLTLEATHRTAHGLYFQANYTLAHNISDAQGDAPGGFSSENLLFTPSYDQFNLRAARGNVAGMPRQRFLLTGTYALPFGPGREWTSKSKVANALLGGWNLNTVTLLQSGPWLTPTISPTEDQSNTDIVGRGGITARPDAVGSTSSPGSGVLWNINGFAPTPANAGRIGNAGVGILPGPGTIAVSAGLSKTFAITERARLRFESTFTNALNHTNFAPPASNVSSPETFGALQSAQTAGQGGNRTGQLALRLDF